jgi:hypothetical protein
MAKRFTDGHWDWLYHYYTKYDTEDFVRYSHLMQYKEFTLAQQLKFYINWTIEHGWPNNTYSVY